MLGSFREGWNQSLPLRCSSRGFVCPSGRRHAVRVHELLDTGGRGVRWMSLWRYLSLKVEECRRCERVTVGPGICRDGLEVGMIPRLRPRLDLATVNNNEIVMARCQRFRKRGKSKPVEPCFDSWSLRGRWGTGVDRRRKLRGHVLS